MYVYIGERCKSLSKFTSKYSECNRFFMTRINTIKLNVPVYVSPTLFVVMRVSCTMNPREELAGLWRPLNSPAVAVAVAVASLVSTLRI